MGSVARKGQSRPANRTEYLKGTAFDRIKYYYLGKITKDRLRPSDLKIVDRWENIWRLYKTHLKTSVAVQLHLSWCRENGHDITERAAYLDLQNSSKIWGKIAQVDRQAKLLLLDEMATETYTIARDQLELGEMNRAIANLLKINEQVEEFMEDSREPHKYELHIHVDGQKRALDLNKLPVQNTAYREVLQQMEEQESDEDTFARLVDETEQDDTEI